MACMSVTRAKGDNVVTVRQAARTLGVSEATIRRRVDDGQLAGFRLGTVRRVLRSELDRLTVDDRRTA